MRLDQSCGLRGQSAGIKKERVSSGSSEGRRKSCLAFISFSGIMKKMKGKEKMKGKLRNLEKEGRGDLFRWSLGRAVGTEGAWGGREKHKCV